jgi:hypothetical protein
LVIPTVVSALVSVAGATPVEDVGLYVGAGGGVFTLTVGEMFVLLVYELLICVM